MWVGGKFPDENNKMGRFIAKVNERGGYRYFLEIYSLLSMRFFTLYHMVNLFTFALASSITEWFF